MSHVVALRYVNTLESYFGTHCDDLSMRQLLSYIVQRAKDMREEAPILDLLGNAEVTFSINTPNPSSSRGGSKRVDNKKLRHFLRTCGADLRYPNFRR